MEAGFLVAIIIVIVSFVLISGVIYRWYGKAEDTAAEQLCHDSISFRAATALNVNENSQDYIQTVKAKLNAPVLCKTIDKKVKATTKEKVMGELAEKMARCWWMFGEGRYEQILHNSKILPAIYNLDYEAENKCFLCYAEVTGADEFTDKEGNPSKAITTEEFLTFLSNHNYSKVKQKSYLDYIQTYGGPGALMLLNNIEPGKAYGISFLAKNKETTNSFKSYLEGTLKGVSGVALSLFAGGVVAGAGTACVVSGVCLLVVGASFALAVPLVGSAADDLRIVELFHGAAERDVSIVELHDLESAQRLCFKGDLGGN